MKSWVRQLYYYPDETSVLCITRSLGYQVYGDDGRHFNRELINALYNIGTTEAIEGIKLAQSSSDELVKSHAEDFLARLP